MQANESLRERLLRVAKDGPFLYTGIVDRILAELGNVSAAPSELAEISEQLRSQDNSITSDPIFEVQERVLELGFDPEYTSDELCWYHPEGEVVFKEREPERWQRFEDGVFGEDDGDGAEWKQTGFRWRWQYVQPFLTRAAAEHYCATQSYNHRGPLRVYVGSGHRNPEWKLLRKVIGGLGA